MIAGTVVCNATLASPFGIIVWLAGVYDMQDKYMSAARARVHAMMGASVGELANVWKTRAPSPYSLWPPSEPQQQEAAVR